VPIAGAFERIGFGAAATGGYGYTESVLGEGDVHQRLFATVAASFRANEWLALALRLDGRYDWHRHVATGDQSGWVGEPHLAFRASPNMAGDMHVGVDASIGFPGEHVPSIDLSAISPELSAFATYAPTSTPLAVTVSSTLYAVVHLKTPEWTFLTALELGGLFLLGCLLAFCYLRTQQLYLAIGLHASLAYGARLNKLLIEFSDPSMAWLVGTSRLINGVASWIALLVIGAAIAWWTGHVRLRRSSP